MGSFPTGRRYFTLEEANRLVPRVSTCLERAIQLHILVRSNLQNLANRGYRITPALLEREDGGGLVGEARDVLELAQVLYTAAQEQLREVTRLGVQIKGLEQGLVDFPSYLDGRTEVLLCWKLGERRIEYFHRPDAGYAGRRPVHGRVFFNAPLRTDPPPRGATS